MPSSFAQIYWHRSVPLSHHTTPRRFKPFPATKESVKQCALVTTAATLPILPRICSSHAVEDGGVRTLLLEQSPRPADAVAKHSKLRESARALPRVEPANQCIMLLGRRVAERRKSWLARNKGLWPKNRCLWWWYGVQVYRIWCVFVRFLGFPVTIASRLLVSDEGACCRHWEVGARRLWEPRTRGREEDGRVDRRLLACNCSLLCQFFYVLPLIWFPV